MKYLSKNRIKGAFFVLAYILLIIIIWQYVSSILVDKEAVRNIVSKYGLFSPIIFILLQIIQNIIAPIAHYPILLAGGFIFGPILGFLYNWVGTSIGTCLIILLVKKFGRPLVERMVSQRIINKYDNIIKKLSPFGLFIIYFLPGFPDDEISYLVALSSMPTKSILIAIILGKTGGATLSFVGNDLASGTVPTLIINIVILLIGLIFYFHKHISKFLKKPKSLVAAISRYGRPRPAKKHIIIYSHGFGTRQDDIGLLTDIAQALPEAESILFDYFKIDEEAKTMTICSLSSQTKKLDQVINETRKANPEAIIDLICHSQGIVVAALARPNNIRKTILLAPVFDMGLERTLARYRSRPDADINLDGISKLPPLEGLIRIVPQEYWQERVTIKPIIEYNELAKTTEIIAIKAKQDQLLLELDLSGLDSRIKVMSLDGDHNFNSSAREPLIKVIRDLLI